MCLLSAELILSCYSPHCVRGFTQGVSFLFVFNAPNYIYLFLVKNSIEVVSRLAEIVFISAFKL